MPETASNLALGELDGLLSPRNVARLHEISGTHVVST
jgi:hypothetical protein